MERHEIARNVDVDLEGKADKEGRRSAPCNSAQKLRTNFAYMESLGHSFTLLNSLLLDRGSITLDSHRIWSITNVSLTLVVIVRDILMILLETPVFVHSRPSAQCSIYETGCGYFHVNMSIWSKLAISIQRASHY